MLHPAKLAGQLRYAVLIACGEALRQVWRESSIVDLFLRGVYIVGNETKFHRLCCVIEEDVCRVTGHHSRAVQHCQD